MIIIAPLRQRVSLRADLPAATLALAQIAGPGPQLDQSASINKAALDCIYPLSPPTPSNTPSPRSAVTALAPLPKPNPHSAAPLSRS
jgi:hypothetical protein